MTWSDTYVGIPQADLGRSELGCDCWGLTRLVYQRELGIDLPSYRGAYVSPDEHEEIAGLISEAEEVGPWRVADHPAPFNLLVFRRGRLRSHLGLRVNSRFMLHMDGTDQARLADLQNGRWRRRLAGEYRHIKCGVAS
jgi:cell wall-associated NlpC family hydrolase